MHTLKYLSFSNTNILLLLLPLLLYPVLKGDFATTYVARILPPPRNSFPSSVTREFTFMNRDYAVKCVCVIGCCFAIHHSQCSRLTAGNKFRMLGDFCNTDGDEQIGIHSFFIQEGYIQEGQA